MPGKTHQTAVAVVPPEEVGGPIQMIRRRHDRQVNRWMPHVNLLYPFRPRAELPEAAPRLLAACGPVAPFTVSLGELRYFRHGSGSCTLWLAPEPAEALRRLQEALQAAFPDCDDLSRFPAGFTPHLSVGQFRSAADCERVQAELQRAWRPIQFRLGEVSVLARGPDGPFEVECRIALGLLRA
jgi:2'-5' RNA ligase